jgi:hypothetical protein
MAWKIDCATFGSGERAKDREARAVRVFEMIASAAACLDRVAKDDIDILSFDLANWNNRSVWEVNAGDDYNRANTTRFSTKTLSRTY